jgi:hypothetical protein
VRHQGACWCSTAGREEQSSKLVFRLRARNIHDRGIGRNRGRGCRCWCGSQGDCKLARCLPLLKGQVLAK